MNRKYELLKDDAINIYGHTLYRIKVLKDFNDVHKGDLGGYIEKEDNLSHFDNCWVYNDAKVFDNARVYDNAMVFGNASVSGNAMIYNNAKVYGNAMIYNNAKVYGNAEVYGNAIISGNAKVYDNAKVLDNAWIWYNANVYDSAGVSSNTILSNNTYISDTNDYLCIGPIGSRNDYTTFYRTKDKGIWVRCGCFNNSIEEFERRVKEVHKDTKYEKPYLTAIEFAKANLM